MGTIVAVQKNNSAVIASDCWNLRDSMMKGSINIGGHCLLRVGDSYIGLNSTAGFQSAFEEALSQIGPKNLSFGSRSEIYSTFNKIHEFMRQQSFMLVHFQSAQDFEWTPMNAILLNRNGLFKVDTTRAVYEFSKFWAVGSGEAFALGAMQAVYKSAETNTSEQCEHRIGSENIAQIAKASTTASNLRLVHTTSKDNDNIAKDNIAKEFINLTADITAEQIACAGLSAVRELDPNCGSEFYLYHLQQPLVALDPEGRVHHLGGIKGSDKKGEGEPNTKVKRLPSRIKK